MSLSYALTIPAMFSLSTKDDTFGIPGYDAPKIYQDPSKAIKDREMAKIKKGQKFKGTVTRRGHYLEDLKKMQVGPGPMAYNIVKPLVPVNDKNKKPDKKNMNISKNTYIDMIFHNAEKRKSPAPGDYKIFKTDEDMKKELQKMKEKPKRVEYRGNFLNDYEYLGNAGPGPGQYNPRKEIVKIRTDPFSPEKWRNKHKQQSVNTSSSIKLPTVGSYDPLPLDTTFARILKENEKKKGSGKSKTNFWGLEDRFKDPKKNKSKSYVNIPGPGNYNVLIEWEGKIESTKSGTTKKKTVNLSKIISKGVDKSIYYENSMEKTN